MTKTLLSVSLAAFLGSLAFQASAAALPASDSSVARAERPEKPEKKEKVGALDGTVQLAREATERPRGADNERPGDRQRRGGRNA